jgi:hypothetical protein
MCRAAQALPECRDDGARMYGLVRSVCWECCLVLLRSCCVVGVWTAMRSKEIKGPAVVRGSGTFWSPTVRPAISCSHISSFVCVCDN